MLNQIDMFAAIELPEVKPATINGKPVLFELGDKQWNGYGRIPKWFFESGVLDLQTGLVLTKDQVNQDYGWWRK